LIAMYPTDSPDEVVRRVGTIDIAPFDDQIGAPAG